MKNAILFTAALVLLFVVSLDALPVNSDMAMKAARTHLHATANKNYDCGNTGNYSVESKYSISGIEILTDEDTGDILAYIVRLNPAGHITISSDTDIRPVIAYSYHNDFIMEDCLGNIPLHMLTADMKLRREALPFTNKEIILANNELWKEYIAGERALINALTTATIYGPWVDTKWGQSGFYSDRCPTDPETGMQCVTGCVATAMAQIVNYWEYPPSVSFSADESYYSTITTPSIWINATTGTMDTIDYNGLGSNPSHETIADLMFACGISLEMEYSSEGSSSDTRYIPGALLDKYDYESADGKIIVSPDFWDILTDNMVNALPAVLGIGGMEVGGHAIVCDGYKTSGEYHLNMGWEGYLDGWYFLPDGMPAGFTIVGHEAIDMIPPVITGRPPHSLKGFPIVGGYVHLDWREPMHITEEVLDYNVYRKSLSETEHVLIWSGDNLWFTDSTVDEMTMYSYRITACYADRESGPAEVDLYSGIYNGWARAFGGDGSDRAYSIAPTEEYGCIAVGYIEVGTEFQRDAYIVRTNSGGDSIWAITKGGDQDDMAKVIIPISDGAFAIAGVTESYGAGAKDIWLFKLDEDANIVWECTYGGEYDDECMAITETDDGGFIIAGYTSDGVEEKLYLIKITSAGDTVWTKKYAGGMHGYSVCNLAEGGYAIAGYIDAGPLGAEDAFLMKTDENGDSLWTKYYGGTLTDRAYAVATTPDGGFAIAGLSRSFSMPIYSALYIAKTDEFGDTLWQRNYGGMGNYEARSLANTIDGGILVAGSCANGPSGDLYIVEFNSDGDSTKTLRYGTGSGDGGYYAIEIADTGIIISGYTSYRGTDDMWILKVGGEIVSSAMENMQTPERNILSVYPNPFNSTVNIAYDVAEKALVSMDIYSINGIRVASPLNKIVLSGKYVVRWDASHLPAGIYLVRIVIGDETARQRMIYLK